MFTNVYSLLPNPVSVAATVKISDVIETKPKLPANIFPYLEWYASICVTNFLSLIGPTNTKPPLKRRVQLVKII